MPLFLFSIIRYNEERKVLLEEPWKMNDKNALLGLDIGTTNISAVVIDVTAGN